MKRTTIYLPEQLKEKLNRKAKEKGIQFSELVRYILFQCVEEDDSK